MATTKENTLDLSALVFVNEHAEEARREKRRMERKRRIERERITRRNRTIAAFSLVITLITSISIGVLASEPKKESLNNSESIVISSDEVTRVTNYQKPSELVYEQYDLIIEPKKEEDVKELQYTYSALNLSQSDIEFYERIVMAECYDYFTEDEMLLIASVIRNRVESKNHPNTVYEVLTEKNQFETYSNNRYLEVTPNENCKRAVARAIAGDTNLNTKVEYFCTSQYYKQEATFPKTKQFFHSLENHDHWNFQNVMMFKIPD